MKRVFYLLIFILFLSVLFLPSCGDDDKSPVNPGVHELVERFNLETLPEIPYPPDNQYNPDRIELGRLLFYDPILSGEQRSTCGTCHHPAFAFGDDLDLPVGVSDSKVIGPGRELIGPSKVTGDDIELTPRNSPTIFNVAFNSDTLGRINHLGVTFWDGRAKGLEAQAKLPPTSRAEMRGDRWSPMAAILFITTALNRNENYVELFKKAFPKEAKEFEDGVRQIFIDEHMYARAIAAFERELVTRNSAYDRFIKGQSDALTDQQKLGLELFFTKGKCGDCHTGPMLSDFKFHVVGVPTNGPGKNVIPGDDCGREEFTKQPSDRYAFRTPTIRNVSLTPPYMHNGILETLHDVMKFYNEGSHPRHHALLEDNLLHASVREPLGLTDEEIDAIVAFMESLEDNGTLLNPKLLEVPSEVPSGLEPLVGARPVVK